MTNEISQTLQEEINQALKKNLPAEVGNVLKERIELIPKLENDLQEANKNLGIANEKIKANETEIIQMKNTISGLEAVKQNWIKKEDELNSRDREITFKEIRVSNEVTKREMAENNANSIKELVGIIFQNPVVRKTICENQSGQWVYNSQTNMNEFKPDGNKTIVEENKL